jgi:anti-anti-sigma factor
VIGCASRSSSHRALAVDLQLNRGRPGAYARVEVHERPAGRVALVQLGGAIDPRGVERLTRALDDLALRGIEQLIVDCARLRHIDYRAVPGLAHALSRYERQAGGVVLCGWSHYLRDLFRLAGCGTDFRCWPSAAELLDETTAIEATREQAS